MVRRKGWRENHKRVHCLYKQEGMSLLPCRPRHSRSARRRQPRQLEDQRLGRLIRTSFIASHGVYGAPRVLQNL